MARVPRPPLIAARVSPATKARFVSLARQHGLSESSLLARLVDTVLEQNVGALDCRAADQSFDLSERVSLRLRPGDRARISARAAARQMKLASYLTVLIRAHVRDDPPMPIAEINALKLAVSQLSATHRCLHQIGQNAPTDMTADFLPHLHTVADQVDDVRRYVSGLVRGNLISWEAGDV